MKENKELISLILEDIKDIENENKKINSVLIKNRIEMIKESLKLLED